MWLVSFLYPRNHHESLANHHHHHRSHLKVLPISEPVIRPCPLKVLVAYWLDALVHPNAETRSCLVRLSRLNVVRERKQKLPKVIRGGYTFVASRRLSQFSLFRVQSGFL